MKKVTGIFKGEKIDLVELKRDDKIKINLYVLSGFELLKMAVRDNALWQKLKAIPNRKELSVKAEVKEFKGELYLQVLEIV